MSHKFLRSNSTIFLVLSTILVFTSLVTAQKPQEKGPKFDTVDFSKKFEIVQWLVEYDEVAWKTSDVVMTEDKTELAKLGTEWFCFQDYKKRWHAVYGKMSDGIYTAVFHYTFDNAGKIARSADKLDQPFLNVLAKSLGTARTRLTASIPPKSPTFNQYVRKNSDGTVGVWMLPAFQPSGTAVFGGEAYYQIDPTGSRILKEESHFQPNFRGFIAKPPREIWIDYPELDMPTLGGIFFVWYYKPYFTKIFLDTAKSTSSLVKTGDSGYIWVNVEKDDAKATKPEK